MPYMAPAGHPAEGGRAPERIREPKGGEGGEQVSLPNSATLVVSVPADAKLAVDGYLTASTSAVRTLTSPVLENGKEYVYTLKAEVVRDGKTVTTTKEVAVHSGDLVKVAMDMGSSVAQK